MRNFGVIIIGDEILSGRRSDKHLAHAISLLAERGLQLSWARYVGDDRPRLVQTLRDTFASGDVVFSFGGIGATPDDHTRQAAAQALGLPLALHPQAEHEIRARFGDETTPQRLRMGEFPSGCDIVPNSYNGIPGFACREHYFLPGFPQMAWPMMAWALDTHYRALHHAHPHAESSIDVFDARESDLVDLMTTLQERFGVTIFSLPTLAGEGGRRMIELGAKGLPDAVDRAMRDMRAEMTARGYEWRESVVRDKR
ncbi:competence/damage-inducible protein A [Uliginosibacterium sp. sgz301328]|uniref:competence/damage-inducible protein A n=1 Tax=Uliginosibacterium sp. sgz301328 TaxID=3243764 RepID=UPI00359F0FFF